MIAYLKGFLKKKTPDQAVIDISGVGYNVRIPLSTYLKISETGEPVELLIHTHMTDSSISLYGFHTEGEKDLFMKLIGISGIGPKIALNILSGIGASDLKEAIIKGDTARISLVPGIGKKTAMRITLELQEKIGETAEPVHILKYQEQEDLISALMNLGFKRREVERIVEDTLRELSGNTDFDTLLRESLKALAKM